MEDYSGSEPEIVYNSGYRIDEENEESHTENEETQF
jgi:hypothetical protein